MDIRIKKLITGLLLIWIYNSYTVNAAFEDVEIGAKATSLAGAYVAQPDDMSGIFYNPAGLVLLKRPEILTAYERMYIGLTDKSVIANQVVGLGMPFKFGSMGLAWHSLDLKDLYNERMIKLGYGRAIKNRIYCGISISSLQLSYGKTVYTKINPLFIDNGYSKSGIGLDGGVIYEGDSINLGVSVLNINEPDMGLKYTNKVCRKISAGISVKQRVMDFNLAAVLLAGEYRVKTGIESWIYGRRLALRGGLNIGALKYRNAALGIGYAGDSYKIDYSFIYPLSGIASTYGSHKLSFIFKWGKGKKEKEEIVLSPEDIMQLKKQYFMASHGLYSEEKYEEARIGFNEVLKLDPVHEESRNYIRRAHFMVGHTLYKEEKYAEAIKEFKKVLESYPEHQETHNYINRAYFMEGHTLFREGKYAESIKEFEKVLESYPEHQETHDYINRAHFMEGHVFFKEGKYAESIRAFKKVLESYPEHKETHNYIKRAHFMAGYTLFKEGQYTESIVEFEKVLKVDPQHKEATNYINRAKKMITNLMEEVE
ncbi:tetratricopeptide repeat protein [Elusimicrobiota bacterium]